MMPNSKYDECKPYVHKIYCTVTNLKDDELKTNSVENVDEESMQEKILSLDRLYCPMAKQRNKDCLRCCPAVKKKIHATQPIFYTDVVVVGNGPSALALSSFLAGYRPFYNCTLSRVNNNSLHEKLSNEKSKSLLEQDLMQLCDGIEGRTNHQVSLLYDNLVRPDADVGQENPSSLTWRRDEHSNTCTCDHSDSSPNYVPHVVLGKGAVGGTWADLAPEVMSLSFASWLDLPAYSFRQWLEKDGANFATDLQMKIDASKLTVGRVPCAAVRRYYRDYVRALGLEEHIYEYALVTSIRKRCPVDETSCNETMIIEQYPEYTWDIFGCYSGGTFHFRCRRVVLATGVTIPRQLCVPGEDNPQILHSTNQLDRAMVDLMDDSSKFGYRRNEKSYGKRTLEPVLIIGDGLNAADAVIRCLINGIPVLHSFRKTPKDPKQILSKLSKVLYPEYHTIFQLMIGAAKDPLYTVYPRTQVLSFEMSTPVVDNLSMAGMAVIENLKTGSVERVRFSRVAILIGYEADLSFLNIDDQDDQTRCRLARDPTRPVDSRGNTLNVDPFTGRCMDEQDLYAVGPLIGDNFVRYVVGGCLATAADILRRK